MLEMRDAQKGAKGTGKKVSVNMNNKAIEVKNAHISSVTDEVADILERRRGLLPEILSEIEACAESGKDLTDLESALSSLAKCVENASYSAELHEAAGFVASAKKDCRRRISALADLRDEFSRETLNLGVSGEARVGKSTTLQGFTGLGDTQIPTGKGLPVTAVRSEIYNDGRNCADIEFRSVAEFMNDFIAPHLANVNTACPFTLSIASLDSLRKANLDIKLDADAPTCAADSLHQLKMAQRDIDSFAGLLGGGQENVPLDAIR
ncbi:MAG: hypothetical protein PUD81_01715, partial [Eggerthellales bacterium]|nr:hypothetical protein [Eggerthellales bacterium]